MNIRYAPPVGGIVASVKSFFGRGKDKADDDDKIIDVDGEEILYKEDVIGFVKDELTKRKAERNGLELQWTLNANFLIGNQFCDINLDTMTIEQIEPAYDWLERDVFNRIAPLIETRIANLKKINYNMRVNPRTNELDDYQKAEVSTAILQHMQSESDFDVKKNTMIAWNELCGNCFWLAWWDKNKGLEVASEKVLVSDEDGTIYRKEVAYHEGDVDYGLITPYEIFPESVFKQSVEAQRSIILEQVKSVDDIYDLYGLEVEGNSVDTFELTPLPGAGGFGRENTVMSLGHRKMDNAEKVITYFEKPSRKRPHGRMIIIVGDNNLVYYGDMPYESIPIVQVVCKEIAGQFFGKSVIEDLIPLQRAYNGCVNRIHEYIKRCAVQSYVVPEGAVDIDDLVENGIGPGEIIPYQPGMAPPVPIQNGNLPAEIMTERYNLTNDMEYVAGVSQLMVTGNTPRGVTSGTAIQNLQEIDNTRLSLTGDYIRNSVKNLAKLCLHIFKRYANTKRVMQYVGINSIQNAIVWSNEDINSYDIEFTTENELMQSEEMQKQKFFEAYNSGMFTDNSGRIPERVKQRALRDMQMGNYDELMNINQLQIQAAQRENVFFEQGVIPEISDFDEHEIHIDEHMRFILQMKFRILKQKKPELAMAFENHIRQHQQIIAGEQTQKMMLQEKGDMNHE